MGFGPKAFIFIALYDVWDLESWVRRHHCPVAFQGSQSFCTRSADYWDGRAEHNLNDLGSVKATQMDCLDHWEPRAASVKMRGLTWSQVSSFKLSSALQTTRSLLDYGTCETWLVVVHLMANLGIGYLIHCVAGVAWNSHLDAKPASRRVNRLRRPLSWPVYDIRHFYQDDTESIPAQSILPAGRLSLSADGWTSETPLSVSIDNDCI